MVVLGVSVWRRCSVGVYQGPPRRSPNDASLLQQYTAVVMLLGILVEGIGARRPPPYQQAVVIFAHPTRNITSMVDPSKLDSSTVPTVRLFSFGPHGFILHTPLPACHPVRSRMHP